MHIAELQKTAEMSGKCLLLQAPPKERVNIRCLEPVVVPLLFPRSERRESTRGGNELLE